MVQVKFKHGLLSNLQNAPIDNGSLLITTDERALYFDVDGARVRIGDFIQVANIDALPAAGAAHEGALYYAIAENVLAKWQPADGETPAKWIQINKQPTVAEMKQLLGLGSAAYADAATFETAGAAAAVQAAVVGTVDDTKDAKTIEGARRYAEALTADMASSEVVDQIQADLDVAEEKIADLEAAIGEGGAVADQIETAIGELDYEGGAFGDNKYAAKVTEVDGVIAVEYAELPDYTDEFAGKVDKVANATAGNFAGVDAQGNVIDSGKKAADFVDATAYATDKEAADAKFAKLEGAANVAGSVAEAKAAADAAQAAVDAVELQLVGIGAEEGAVKDYVDDAIANIPAVVHPEYTIVKDENAGDFAAIYHLTKDGVNTGATINIPKDMVVQAGAVVTDPAGQPAGTYIELTLQNVEAPLYINVGDLIEYVTSGSQAGDQVVITVDNQHQVTAALSAEVQASLAKADSALQNLDGVKVTVAGKELANNGVITATEIKTALNLGDMADEAKANYVLKSEAAGYGDILTKTEAATTYVAQEANARLITETEAAKLEGIAAGAQVNVIEAVKVNGAELGVANKAVDIAIVEGTANGTIKVNGADVAVHGLGTAAFAAANAFDAAGAADAVLGVEGDAATANTVYGAKAFAVAEADGAEAAAKEYTDNALTWGTF